MCRNFCNSAFIDLLIINVDQNLKNITVHVFYIPKLWHESFQTYQEMEHDSLFIPSKKAGQQLYFKSGVKRYFSKVKIILRLNNALNEKLLGFRNIFIDIPLI